ncbi:hypothetical protein VP01_726g1 [Puccinia sorghi]|uniref:RRM domain-containing protein n=1 Tax=Puccinia sorghi TaxID=27349 RepID=A0A0L6UD15_9BASI|nr:hypothetical protein VP01_726g1 [Puccinia sorghi]
MLYDTFSTFGTLVQTAKIARNPTTGQSNGYGFVAYESFEAADTAIESMNGQFLMNKAITVQYAFKKDGKGERHGTPAERLLAAQARKNNALPSGAGGNALPAPPPSAPNPMRYVAPNLQTNASNNGAQNGAAFNGPAAHHGYHHQPGQHHPHHHHHHNPAMSYHKPTGGPGGPHGNSYVGFAPPTNPSPSTTTTFSSSTPHIPPPPPPFI